MQRFLAKLLVFVLLQASVVSVAFCIYLKRFPPGDSLYAAGADKISLLRTQTSPRLIFVGGSSMAMGMDSALVARQLGFHPVNMGLHIGIGLEFMLQEVEPLVRSGDVVVVSPEYHAFEKYYAAEPEYLARLIECSPSVLALLSWSQLQGLLDQGYAHHLGRVLRSMGGAPVSGMDQVRNEHSGRHSFNSNGDQISHERALAGSPIQRGSVLPFAFTGSARAQAAVAHLNRFFVACRGRGARVFFSHPPYERKYFDRYRDSIRRLDELLQQQLQIPMLDSAEEMAFPSEEIYDLEYHLNSAGKEKRARLVAARLGKALAAAP